MGIRRREQGGCRHPQANCFGRLRPNPNQSMDPPLRRSYPRRSITADPSQLSRLSHTERFATGMRALTATKTIRSARFGGGVWLRSGGDSSHGSQVDDGPTLAGLAGVDEAMNGVVGMVEALHVTDGVVDARCRLPQDGAIATPIPTGHRAMFANPGELDGPIGRRWRCPPIKSWVSPSPRS